MARKRGGETLLACRLAGLSAPSARSAGRRSPPNVASPASMPGTMRFSQTQQVAFLPNPPRHPTASAARAQKARTGAGRATATNTSSFHQHPYRICYYCSVGGIFLTEGFQATIRLPKGPPRPSQHSLSFVALPRRRVPCGTARATS
jgi:hypothetical protein